MSNVFHKKCLYALLDVLLDYLNQYQIFYFIDGGTLLGAIREGEIIDHDDDIDLGVLDCEFDKLAPILDALDGEEIYIDDKIFNIHIQIINGILKLYLPQFRCLYKSDLGNPCIDIFRWTLEDGKYQLLPKEFREQFKNCYYEYDEMYPRKNYYLLDVEVKGANIPNPYLMRYYGDDCLKVKKKYIRDEKGFKNDFVIIE
jgi:phosphorylcholine metabolism protein LicD